MRDSQSIKVNALKKMFVREEKKDPFDSYVIGDKLMYDLNKLLTKASKYKQSIAYYVGSFDPFHNGHLTVVKRTLEYAENIIIYPLPCDGKRKSSKPFDLRCKIILESLPTDIVSRIVVVQNEDLYSVRETLAKFQSKFRWYGVIGDDNRVLSSEKLSKVYFVRAEYEKNVEVPFDVLVSSAVTVTLFLVFTRDREKNDDDEEEKRPQMIGNFDDTSQCPELCGKFRPIIWISDNSYDDISSTMVRKAVKENDWETVNKACKVNDNTLEFLKEYII